MRSRLAALSPAGLRAGLINSGRLDTEKVKIQNHVRSNNVGYDRKIDRLMAIGPLAIWSVACRKGLPWLSATLGGEEWRIVCSLP
jgi:hypothetical protein